MPSSSPVLSLSQSSLPGFCPVTEAVNALSRAGIEERGAIFTRREVVDFILDLVGYTDDHPLHKRRLLEPSFGAGDFLLPAVGRLLSAWRKSDYSDPLESLSGAVRAVELHTETFRQTRAALLGVLRAGDIDDSVAEALADTWLINGDYLLTPIDGPFDAVVGNPPYVRQEMIADVLMAEYRARYRTIYDRADIYIPFIERSLTLLGKDGQLGFICADRWMKNRYGGPLRKMVTEGFNLRVHVDMVDTPAFHTEVVAYPSIFVIAREKHGVTRIAHRPSIDRHTLSSLAAELVAAKAPAEGGRVKLMQSVASGSEPWILESADQLAVVRRLEADFPLLEEAGCKVGIGVATGADKAYIAPFEELDVEDDRKLSLAMTRDIADGEVHWRGYGVINPFGPDGRLVDLAEYPRLERYLEARRSEIASRHVAQKIPANWYRTIDRIYPELAAKPKLLIPDIRGEASIVYEDGRLYPHHNLYYITSDDWDIKALQAVLLSGIARLFVSIYSTKMRGGYLRFQAQYLRRIRIPRWSAVPEDIRRELIAAAERRDAEACNCVVFSLYGFSKEERAAIGGNGA